MSNKISYEEACYRIRLKQCEPLFSKSEWIGSRKNKKTIKYWFKDKKGHSFYREYDAVVNGNKVDCVDCAKQNQINKQKLTEVEYNDYINIFKKDKNIQIITDYSNYKNIKQKLECQCLLCNKNFKESISNIIKKESHGCESMPKGEQITMIAFEKYGVKYNYQVYIKELNLTSDFEIELYNGKVIHLEIDGDQHYEFPNGFHRTYEEFLQAKERDNRKDNWYLQRGCRNIHIRYNVGGKRNDDIKLILNDIIKGTYGECVFDNIRSDFDISNIIKISPKNKKIISYTLDGNFHNVYENILQAEQDLNVDNSCISECLNGKRNVKRAGKYMFMLYEENFQLKIEPYKKSSSKPILIYKDGVFIEEIPSLNELERKYKIPKSSLCRYLNGKGNNPLKNNYDFKYKAI